LMLTGSQVSEFFEPSIQSTVDAIKDPFRQRLPINSFAFLVGGFATSPWFSEQLQRRVLDIGFQFCKPDTNTNKAVAVGAVSYYVDRLVTGRISKFTYGVPCSIVYDPGDPEHAQRLHKSYTDFLGEKRIPDHFVTMLSRGTKVLEDREIRHKFCCISEGAPPQKVVLNIIKYTGSLVAPEWGDKEKDKFETLCHVEVDLFTTPYTSKINAAGKVGYRRDCEAILLVGLTELKAQLSWIDSITKKEKRSDAVVVFEGPSETVVGDIAKG